MNITTKFNIGQKVWVVTSYNETTTETCLACDGKGKIKHLDGRMYQCGNCKGAGTFKHTDYSKLLWKIERTMKIEYISVEVATDRAGNIHITSVYSSADQTDEEFDSVLFPSRKLAQEYCDKKMEDK